MKIIEHKFKNHQISPDTEILIIGTFNPNSPDNPADFFYSRNRNNLWRLLPIAFGQTSLKNELRNDKISFSKKSKIDFIDLIVSVEIEEGQETNYDDHYLDDKVIEWTDIISVISKLKNLNKVCFTRKTFSGIPNMKEKIFALEDYCRERKIIFTVLVTPARFYSVKKQNTWNEFFNSLP